LSRVGLSARARHYPAELSGGQQQRVAIARALAGSPRLLLADEPTGNLDTQMARGVLDLLEELHRDGATIVMVTHDPELAVRAQREVHIVDGQVVDLAAQPRGDAPPPGRLRRSCVFSYYFNLALRSLKRNVVLTALMIAAIGVGIGASMTTLTVFRAMSGDPIPAKIAPAVRGTDRQLGPAAKACARRRSGGVAAAAHLYRLDGLHEGAHCRRARPPCM
jgi:energy-coupling factor transporter ATP-binding protein EcfA2